MLKPLSDRVLILPDEPEGQTKGGIILPDSAKERPSIGKVVAVGPGRLLDSGVRQAVLVSESDKVLYSKWSGSDVEIGGVMHKIVGEGDILAVLD